MKKALKAMVMLLFVVSMTALTSCKKEAENLIVGKWECTSAIATLDDETEIVSQYIGWVWLFNNDGIVTTEYNGEESETPIVSTAKYVIDDNQLTFTSLNNEETIVYTIKELTSSKLSIELPIEEDSSLSLEFKKV